MTRFQNSPQLDDSTADSDKFVRYYLDALVENPETLCTAVHETDEMFAFTEKLFRGDVHRALCSYLGSGKQIFDAAAQLTGWAFGGFHNVTSFLDFACGYGRFTRFLVRKLSPERIWACDISAGAVRFQEAQFGVHAMISAAEAKAFSSSQRFDCIFVASLFTHLPERSFVPWLSALYRLLTSSGWLFFSVHDPSINPAVTMPSSGFWFEESSEIDTLDKREYGSTLVTEKFVAAAIDEATAGQAAYLRLPRGLCRFQDIYVVGNGKLLESRNLTYCFGPEGYLETCCLAAAPNSLRLSGWAGDITPDSAIREIQIRINGELAHTCQPAVERPDVANALQNTRFLRSGFGCECAVPGGALHRSDVLTVKVVSTNGFDSIVYHNTVASALELGDSKLGRPK